jgi:UDP-N-acetylglucosamine diphosphorylase/glucosamine-1-phosphate N-acetyltransferase
MSVVIFEDDRWADFTPLSSTRHVGQQVLGTQTVIEHVTGRVDDQVSLSGRGYLSGTVEEETQLRYNERADGSVLMINARINPLVDFERMIAGKSNFALLERGEVAIALLTKRKFEGASAEDGTMPQRKLAAAARTLERIETAEPILFRYPWEMLAANGRALEMSAERAGGEGLRISPQADVEEFVAFEPSSGPIIVGDGARIESFSRISGPCFIGPKTVVRSALVRAGTTIGADCRIGGEVDNSIVYPHSNKAHFGYLGHSIVGEWVNVGAGSATSDLKNTYGTVRVQRGSGRVDSGMQKLGPMIGDLAKTSIGCMIYGGKTVGVGAQCSGLVDLDVPDFTRYDGYRQRSSVLTLPSVTQTLSRMMSRRGVSMTETQRALVERLYAKKGRAARDSGPAR